MIRQMVLLLLILAAGAAVLSPIIMLLDPEPLMGDFFFTWNGTRFAVPVIYSLCASVSLALLYLVMKR